MQHEGFFSGHPVAGDVLVAESFRRWQLPDASRQIPVDWLPVTRRSGLPCSGGTGTSVSRIIKSVSGTTTSVSGKFSDQARNR
jgi:hypothetical protein